jgi:enediyne biosynthesis protein E4
VLVKIRLTWTTNGGCLFIASALCLSSCQLRTYGPTNGPTNGWADLEKIDVARSAPITVATSLFAKQKCGAAFVEHRLAHTTRASTADVLPFDTNGSGLAVGDLDNDGRPDIVLGDLRRTASVLWNTGGFQFDRKPLVDADGGFDEVDTRAVVIVDVDNDGHRDIVSTHTGGGVSVWHNLGNRTFSSSSIDTVSTPAYSMMWDDIDGDGDLDFVTASYDALLERDRGENFLLGAKAGVVVYTQQDGTFVPTRLARSTQALALTMFDATGDGKRELIVGNDFGVPDMIYQRTESAVGGAVSWKLITPFAQTTRNTMAFAVTDVGNDGYLDLFASDMKPATRDAQTIAAWMPLLAARFERSAPGEVQQPENALQRQVAPGSFRNEAYDRQIDATGWSWSAQFGDLDLNGSEDLYVVNGMIDHELLGHLRNDEVAEPNVVLASDAEGQFSPRPGWGIGSRSSGRSMAMVDLNNDGRLDIVVNNLGSPAAVFENQLCRGGESIEVNLQWAGRNNHDAIGARVIAQLDDGNMQRSVTLTGGYLTGLGGQVHFGIPQGRRLVRLLTMWPDGKSSVVDAPKTGQHLTITRTSGS